MASDSVVLLSDYGGCVEAARALLVEYLRLPDAWERFGGVSAPLPVPLEKEIAGFPGEAAPPAGDVIVGRAASGDVVAAGHVVPFEPFVCEFKRLFVRPQARRLGIATRVANGMVDRAIALGYRRAVLDVMPERTVAIAFWSGLGFRACSPFRTYPFAMEFMELDFDVAVASRFRM